MDIRLGGSVWNCVRNVRCKAVTECRRQLQNRLFSCGGNNFQNLWHLGTAARYNYDQGQLQQTRRVSLTTYEGVKLQIRSMCCRYHFEKRTTQHFSNSQIILHVPIASTQKNTERNFSLRKRTSGSTAQGDENYDATIRRNVGKFLPLDKALISKNTSIFCSQSIHRHLFRLTHGRPTFLWPRATLLLWAGSTATRGKITAVGILNCLIFCVTFMGHTKLTVC